MLEIQKNLDSLKAHGHHPRKLDNFKIMASSLFLFLNNSSLAYRIMFVPRSRKVGIHKIQMHFTKHRDFYLMEVATNSEALSITKRYFY